MVAAGARACAPTVAPARVADLLAATAPGPAPVLHRGVRAVYLEVSGWVLGVVAAEATRVPCALTLPRARHDADLGSVAAARVHALGIDLRIGSSWLRCRVARRSESRVPRMSHTRLSDLAELSCLAQPAARELSTVGVEPDAGLPGLLDAAGAGSGLTPLVDDVLCGWLATAVAAGERIPVPDVRGRTTLLSATLVRYAAEGHVLPAFRALIMALDDPRPDRRLEAGRRLVATGHTSGAGLLLGAVAYAHRHQERSAA